MTKATQPGVLALFAASVTKQERALPSGSCITLTSVVLQSQMILSRLQWDPTDPRMLLLFPNILRNATKQGSTDGNKARYELLKHFLLTTLFFRKLNELTTKAPKN